MLVSRLPLVTLSNSMKMPKNSRASLSTALSAVGDLSARSVYGAEATITWSDLLAGTALEGRGDELRGRSVLIATTSQFTTVAALMELDGFASRIVLCPPDFPLGHLAYVIDAAAVDAVVSDRIKLGVPMPRVRYFMPCSEKIAPANYDRGAPIQTEWVLLTSGTTGQPKLVAHTLATLTGAIQGCGPSPAGMVWSTFYDIRRYGGLQIFLRAALTSTSLVLSSARESTAEFLARAASCGVTHISGTPSHWRSALMSPAARLIAPSYVRLSGEIADQAILNGLSTFYPQAKVVHAFASTEAGVAFEVVDGSSGLPANVIDQTPDVDMKIENRSLHIRSQRAAIGYLGAHSPVLKDAEGWVNTGDILELRNGRYYFVGRQDGIINVGGLKVYPEEVEAVINRHPQVHISLVRTKKNPITGALVVADVVLKSKPLSNNGDDRELQKDILLFCREALPSHKVPAAITFVPALTVAETGKLIRPHA